MTCVDVNMRRSEDVKLKVICVVVKKRGCEDVKLRRCEDDMCRYGFEKV